MKKHNYKKKASIALAAIRGEKVAKLSGEHQIHPNVINTWKKVIEDGVENLFLDKRKKKNKAKDEIIDELYKIIGQRDVEISWLKKKYKLKLP